MRILYQGDGTTCDEVNCVPIKGACCLTNGACTVVTQNACNAQGGDYQGDQTICSPGLCQLQYGACCIETMMDDEDSSSSSGSGSKDGSKGGDDGSSGSSSDDNGSESALTSGAAPENASEHGREHAARVHGIGVDENLDDAFGDKTDD